MLISVVSCSCGVGQTRILGGGYYFIKGCPLMDPFDDDEEGKWKTAAAAFAIRERNLSRADSEWNEEREINLAAPLLELKVNFLHSFTSR